MLAVTLVGSVPEFALLMRSRISARESLDCTVIDAVLFGPATLKLPDRPSAEPRLLNVLPDILCAVAIRRISSSCVPTEAALSTVTPIKLPAMDGVDPSDRLVLEKACFAANVLEVSPRLTAPRMPSIELFREFNVVRNSRNASICVVLSLTRCSSVSMGMLLAEMMPSTAAVKSIPVPRPENETREPLIETLSKLRGIGFFQTIKRKLGGRWKGMRPSNLNVPSIAADAASSAATGSLVRASKRQPASESACW